MITAKTSEKQIFIHIVIGKTLFYKEVVSPKTKIPVCQLVTVFPAMWSSPRESAITEVTQGLREYFNVMLGTQLLYKYERPQYAEVRSLL